MTWTDALDMAVRSALRPPAPLGSLALKTITQGKDASPDAAASVMDSGVSGMEVDRVFWAGCARAGRRLRPSRKRVAKARRRLHVARYNDCILRQCPL